MTKPTVSQRAAARKSLTASYLRERMDYCPETGHFTWRKREGNDKRTVSWNNACEGRRAGTLKMSGYVEIQIDKVVYLAHRLAWLHVTGSWPSEFVDHKNGNPTDNRIDNLREATIAQNNANRRRGSLNRSGFKGVHWVQSQNKWVVQSRYNGKRHFLGSFDSLTEAAKAYRDFNIRVRGEFVHREVVEW